MWLCLLAQSCSPWSLGRTRAASPPPATGLPLQIIAMFLSNALHWKLLSCRPWWEPFAVQWTLNSTALNWVSTDTRLLFHEYISGSA